MKFILAIGFSFIFSLMFVETNGQFEKLANLIPFSSIFGSQQQTIQHQSNAFVFGCECSDLMWSKRNGVIVGRCLSSDVDGLPVCYLHQPNSCPDAVDSTKFCNMQVTKLGCGCVRGADGFCRRPNPRLGGRSLNQNNTSNDTVEKLNKTEENPDQLSDNKTTLIANDDNEDVLF